MHENEWVQGLQAVQPPLQDMRWPAPPPQDMRWAHGAPSICPLPASMQHTVTMPPFQSHNDTVRTQDSLFDAPRSSSLHHALGHAHAWPPVSLHPDHSSMTTIGMMNYWPQEYIGTPYSYANNLMQYQNGRHGGAFIQDFAAQHDNVGMLTNADVRRSTMHMQDTADPYHNVSTEGASGNMQRMRMRENIAVQQENLTISMNTEFLANASAPAQAGRHALALQQLEGGAIRWDPYYHDRGMEKVHGAVVQQGQVSANAQGSGGTVMMMTKEECGRPSVRLAERKVQHHSGKDRHSKVKTAKGMRDRRVRLSVSTAAQFYDIQDRLGFQQPSRVFEWLMQKAKHAINQLPASGYCIMEDNDPDAAAHPAFSDHPDTTHPASLNHPQASLKRLHTSVQDPSVTAPVACSDNHHANARLNMGSSSHDPSSSSVGVISVRPWVG